MDCNNCFKNKKDKTYDYDGWEIRSIFFQNTERWEIIPKENSKIDLMQKIIFCEKLLKRYSTEIAYKIFESEDFLDLDKKLFSWGYKKRDQNLIMVREDIKSFEICKENENTIFIDSFEDGFLNKIDKINMNDNFKNIINNFSNQQKVFFYNVDLNGKIKAYGLGIKIDKYIGIFSIFVEEDFRNLGVAYSLVNSIMEWGVNNNCDKAFLNVELNNIKAINLYKKLNFKKTSEYWYRIKSIL